LNQGDQGESLTPPSLILVPDLPDIPEVPGYPVGPAAKNLSHLGRWDGNFSRPTFFEAGGTDFPRPTFLEHGGTDFPAALS
jgi:hypothetical protein